MTQQLKTTALYCRLSKDDVRQGESLSLKRKSRCSSTMHRKTGFCPMKFMWMTDIRG